MWAALSSLGKNRAVVNLISIRLLVCGICRAGLFAQAHGLGETNDARAEFAPELRVFYCQRGAAIGTEIFIVFSHGTPLLLLFVLDEDFDAAHIGIVKVGKK